MSGAGLTRAETERTQWRLDGSIPGISAKIEDGAGREVGIWQGDTGWGHQGWRIGVYAKGRNGQISFSSALSADEARSLADSLRAMAEAADASQAAEEIR